MKSCCDQSGEVPETDRSLALVEGQTLVCRPFEDVTQRHVVLAIM